MHRIIEISQVGVHLHISVGRLVIKEQDSSTKISLKEIDSLIITEPSIALTGHVLSHLTKQKCPIIICDSTYQPCGICLPIYSHTVEATQTLDLQLAASPTIKKQLWQQLIKNKISGQSYLLTKVRNCPYLQPLPAQVQSGDKGNLESRAAVIYWQNLKLFPTRDRKAKNANLLLNYAYTIIYSAFARELCATGWQPRLGIHHHNQYNPFSLASDLMEPYRVFADQAVLHLLEKNGGNDQLSSDNKQQLLTLIYNITLTLQYQKYNIFTAIRLTVHSLKQCLKEKDPSLLILPEWRIK